MRRAMDANIVLNEQGHELLAIHERDGIRVWAHSLFSCALGKIAGGDEQAALVRAEAAAELLHLGLLNVFFPAFDLYRHLDLDHVADNEGAPYVDATVAEIGRAHV